MVLRTIICSLLFSLFITAQAQQDSAISSSKYHSIEQYLDTLFKHYAIPLDTNLVLEKAMESIAKSLDPHSKYLNKESLDNRKDDWAGIKGAGIGVSLNKIGEYVYLSAVKEGFPAQKTGLLTGDKIHKINGFPARALSIQKVVELLKGENNTAIALEALRGKQMISVNMMRVPLKKTAIPFSGKILDNETGYIKLDHFLQGSANHLLEAFKTLKEVGIDRLVIDVRNSYGGLVNQARDIAGIFLPKGSDFVAYKGQLASINKMERTLYVPVDTLIPITVLINNQTVSAGEILAAALQDHDRAKLIGIATKGKGLVQSRRYVTDSTALYFTTAYQISPAGRNIHNLIYDVQYIGIDKNDIVADSIVYSLKTKSLLTSGQGVIPDIKIQDLKNEFTVFETQLKKSQLLFWWTLEWISKEILTKENIDCYYHVPKQAKRDFIRYFKLYLKDEAYWSHSTSGIKSIKENYTHYNTIISNKVVEIIFGREGTIERSLYSDPVLLHLKRH